jgi:formylglycine-generating enzyme required for sulfatase activity
VWNQAIGLGDCLKILAGRKAAVPEGLNGFFERVVMQAIEQEIAVKDRHALTVALGRLGDPRIVVDLRAQSHPDGHPGYVKIPAGKYCFGDKKKRFSISEPFWLSRYPVTNSQYAEFIKAGGYQERELWSEEGWRWREQEQVN